MSVPEVPSSRFVQWLHAVLPAMGVEVKDLPDSMGVEFESDGMTLSVSEHPNDDARVIVEVRVCPIPPEVLSVSGAELMVLHQLNDRARREHDWVISIDGELGLTVGTSARVSELDAQGLQTLMATGLEKGEAVQMLWSDLTEPAASQPPPGDLSASALRI